MIKLFEAHLATIAAGWPDERPGLDAEYRELDRHRTYVSVARIALREIRAQTTDIRVRDLASRPGVIHGLSVIARYFQHATESAAQQDVAFDELQTHLASSAGMDVLSSLATNSNQLAVAGENHLCIRQDTIDSFDHPRNSVYVWQDGVLTHPLLAPTLLKKSEELTTAGRPVIGMCHSEKTHQLQPIASSILAICARDQQLMPATYALHKK